MHHSEADGVGLSSGPGASAARLRAEAVAMLSERAALCSSPAPDRAPPALLAAAPASPPAPVRAPPPHIGADTAALLRELSSLGTDEPLPAVAAEPLVRAPAGTRHRRGGLFARPRGSP